ncbi:actin-like ATPase domain-containing protein, partial [Tuber magnatum]
NGTILSAGELVGELSEKAANELGLVAGIKIGSGVIDAYAGWVGTVGAKVGMSGDSLFGGHEGSDLEQAFCRLAAVAGTSTCHLVMSRDPIFVPGVWGPYRDVLLPGYWMAEGGQSSTGSLLHNVLTTHPSYNEALGKSEELSKNIFEYLNEHLEALRKSENAPTIGYLARHLFFYGDKHGNRSPIADAAMRGAIVGLSMDSSTNDLALQYFAAMEFIAQQTRHIIGTLNSQGHQITSIFMSGGQCKNNILMHLIADATGHPVVIPRYIDAAVVLGAAMLGAKAASVDSEGKTESLWAIMDRMSKPGETIYPTRNVSEKKLLGAKYEVFLRMSEAQRTYRDMVDAAIEDWKA